MTTQELSAFSADQLRTMALSQAQIDSIPLGKRLKMLPDYSEPVRFGPDLWHILSISKDRALIMASSLLENVPSNQITKKLALFFEHHFSSEEKESVVAHADGTRELLCLDKNQVEKYLDHQEKTVGRHWWLRAEEDDGQCSNQCINSKGEPDTTNHTPELCLRPVAKISIPYDQRDKQWNQMWEHGTCTEVNLKGYWKAKPDPHPEKVVLHHVVLRTEPEAPQEEWILLPRIDVTDM